MLKWALSIFIILQISSSPAAEKKGAYRQWNADVPPPGKGLLNDPRKLRTYLTQLRNVTVIHPKGRGETKIQAEGENITVPCNRLAMGQLAMIELDRRKIQRYLEVLNAEERTTAKGVEEEERRTKVVRVLGEKGTGEESIKIDQGIEDRMKDHRDSMTTTKVPELKLSDLYKLLDKLKSQEDRESMSNIRLKRELPNINKKLISNSGQDESDGNSDEDSEQYLSQLSEKRNILERKLKGFRVKAERTETSTRQEEDWTKKIQEMALDQANAIISHKISSALREHSARRLPTSTAPPVVEESPAREQQYWLSNFPRYGAQIELESVGGTPAPPAPAPASQGKTKPRKKQKNLKFESQKDNIRIVEDIIKKISLTHLEPS